MIIRIVFIIRFGSSLIAFIITIDIIIVVAINNPFDFFLILDYQHFRRNYI